MTLRISKSADGLGQRIVMMLETGARPVHWFRSFAASDAMFEQAIGKLFIKGVVKFTGAKRGRKLARAP